MELQRIRNRIQEILTHWVGLINAETNYGQNDKKVTSEPVLAQLLGVVFDLPQLKTLNADSGFNYPGIDLGDATARVAIQVTATSKPNKIIHTIEEFLKHGQYQQFDRLVVYILTEKQSSYSGKKLEAAVQALNQHIPFDLKRDVWDWRAVHNRVAGFTAEQAQRVLDILEANITGQPTTRAIPVRTLPEQYIPRQGKFAEVKARLLEAARTSGKVGITGSVALRGAGGYGKTTLAEAVLADEEVAKAFPDGIWEVVLGENASEASTVGWLNELIKQQTRHNPGFDKIASARDALRKAVVDKRLLLFVDDAWHKEWLQPFCELGCPVLVTTRDARVLPKNALEVEVDHMTPEEAQELLGHGVGEGEWSQPENTARAELANALGQWALLLSLVNISLKDYVRGGQTRLEAIHKIQERLRRKGITHFDGRNAQREAAVALTMEAGLEHLGPELQAFGLDSGHYQQLAIFPPDQPIPLGVLERLWGTDAYDTAEVCSILHKRSLLSQYRNQTILLHDVTRLYLKEKHKAALSQWHQQFLDHFKPPTGHWADLPHSETYVWQWLAHHLQGANQKDQLQAVLADFDFLQNKLGALKSVWSLVEDFEQLEGVEASMLRRAIQMSTDVLHNHPKQLAPQLIGRLSGQEFLQFSSLIHAAKAALETVGISPFLQRPFLKSPIEQKPSQKISDVQISAIASLPDEKFVIASDDRTLRVLNPLDERLSLFAKNLNPILALCALPDGRVVSGSEDCILRIWDIQSGTSQELRGHVGPITSLATLPDGRVISGSRDNTLRVWNLHSGKSQVMHGHRHWINAISALPDGQVVSGSSDCDVRIWDLEKGQSQVLQGHTSSVTALMGFFDNQVISGSYDSTLRFWEPKTMSNQSLKYLGNSVKCIAPLSNEHVIIGWRNNSFEVFDLQNMSTCSWVKLDTLLTCMAVGSVKDKTVLGIGTRDGQVILLQSSFKKN
ncbi:MAG: NB-ARC domain-containing protein [Meiothermus sp.]|nr:NB-ARC domain-containing protein [Meiothermus sp.]